MRYGVNIQGFEDQNLEVKISGWSGPELFVTGKPVPKGYKRGEMLLQRNDGKQVVANWRLPFLDSVPQLIVDGKAIILVEPLKWYQLVWCGLPVLLIIFVILGAVGGLRFIFAGSPLGVWAGFVCFKTNVTVFRTELTSSLKYAVSGIVSAIVVYLVAVVLFSIIRR